MNPKVAITIILLLLFLQSCSVIYRPNPHTPDSKELQIIDNLYAHYKAWKGVQYCFGGVSKSGVDCSGFIYVTFRERFRLILPRGTSRQRNVGDDVSVNDLQAGDLVFFKMGRKKRHVGIYIENGKFMHASSSKGVMISNLKNPYWRAVLSYAKRVNELYR